jgi:hypothetical protein
MGLPRVREGGTAGWVGGRGEPLKSGELVIHQ